MTTSEKIRQRPRVKVCGMTQADNVADVVALGVDAIGMILHAKSPRTISLEQAKLIRQEVPPFVSLVGVFVDCDAQKINHYSTEIGLDLIQLHGDESDYFGEQLNTPFIKAIRAKQSQQVKDAVTQYPAARALLLDPYVKGQHGGTGKRLNLDLWPIGCSTPLILAGGLSADNVASAVDAVSPYAVDLNSGVESQPGIKDIVLLEKALRSLGR